MHEGRNIAYCFFGPEKQTRCLSLLKKKGKHKSSGERPRVDGCSGKGRHRLLILYIVSITQVTSRGGIVSLGHSFNL